MCVEDFDKTAQSSLDEWIYYLKNTEIPDDFTAPGLKEARERLKYDRLSEEEKQAYNHHLKQIRYEQDVVANSYEEGRQKMKEEMEGIIAEKIINIVLNSHKNGISIETIAAITGLTPDEVKEIIACH